MLTFTSNKNYWGRALVLAFFLLATVWTGPVGAADGKARNESAAKDIQASRDHIPLSYDGFGVIDNIGKDQLIINDSVKKLSPMVTYHDQTGRYTSSTEFKVGTRVAYQVNKQREITVLYLFDGQLP